MNYFLHYFSLFLATILVGGGFSSCSTKEPNPEPLVPSFEAKLGTIDAVSVELLLKTTNITEYAWECVLSDDAQELTPAAIFATGTAVKCSDGESVLKISDLDALTDYVVYMAAKTTDNNFYSGKIDPISFKTIDFTDEITIVKRTPDGFVARIRLPEEVIQRKNVIKWQVANVLMYEMNKMQGASDATLLESNDEYYGKFFNESTTLYFDEKHQYKTDENGDMILDENGDPVMYWDFIAPGEPLLLLLGEHEWGESMFGWGLGWYSAMFDFEGYEEAIGGGFGPMMPTRSDEVSEADYWRGYYKNIPTRAAEPTLLDAKVKFETEDLRPNGGTLRFTPEDGVMQYCLSVVDHATYEGQLMPMLDNNEEYLQWFVTSFAGAFLFANSTLDGPAELLLEEIIWDPAPGVPYHILVTAMGDQTGMSQSFFHEIVELPDATLPAPNIVATPIKNPEGEESPYEVWFNVKSPDASAAKVGYACNYLRDFVDALAKGQTYASLISQSRAELSAAELDKVNSSEGYNMKFNSREDAATRFAVMAWNSEGTPSNPDAENSPAVANARTIAVPDAERVESPFFQDLQGEWTATATVKLYQYNEQTLKQEWVDIADPIQTKVTITDGITYPATLPSDVYGLYEDMTKEEVDALYAEFKSIATTFNSKMRGQNRLLCLGFNFDAEKSRPLLSLQTPYDLFTHASYGAPMVEDLFFDFGPKWYMQITSDNSVFVPVNTNRMTPLSSWATSDQYHMVASSTKGGLYVPVEADMNNVEMWPNIPVEVSADKQTITLKKRVHEGDELYPSIIYPYYGKMALFSTKVSSEVVLTRGWSGPEEAKINSRTVRNLAGPSMSSVIGDPVKSLNNGVLKLQEKPKSRTMIVSTPRVEYKKVENFHVVTPEELKANIAKFAKRHNLQTNRK